MYQQVCRAVMNKSKEIHKEADVLLTVDLNNVKCNNDLSLSYNSVSFNMRRSNTSLSSISIEQASMTLYYRAEISRQLGDY